MIPGIIKLEVSVISWAEGQSVITLTKTLIIEDITKTESNNCFIIIHCFKENNNNVAKNLKSYCYGNSCIPANSHALGVSLTPAG